MTSLVVATQEKQAKVQTSVGNVIVNVSWESEGILLVEFLDRGATINPERYVQTLRKLKQRIRRVRPQRKMYQVLLLHDNARQHTSLRTREATATVGWTVLHHPPYSSRFSTPRLPSLWPPEGCTSMTQFCGRRRTETQLT